ncbi:MAG TPA: ABC transporter substrate-binding protein [bacterium]|nr:ABC transporter substrate-binding protein [bacterium]
MASRARIGQRLTRRTLLGRALGAAAGGIGAAALGRATGPFGVPASMTTWPAADAPAVLAASMRPVKLGVLLPYSKVYQQLGEDITAGMILYFESVGWTGGGRRISMIKEDEDIDPQVALRKARKLIEGDNVDLLTGLVASPSAVAIRDIVHNSKTVLVISNAGANVVTRARKSPYIFRASFSNWQTAYPIGKWFYDNVTKSVVCAAADYAAGHEDINAFKESYVAAGGKVTAEVYPPLNNTDYAPYIAQIQRAKPDAVFAFFAGSDAVRFVQQAQQYGLTRDARLSGPGFLVEEDVLPAQGRAALGAYSCLHWAVTLQRPENLAFTRAYRARWKRDASVYAMQGFDAARVIAEALNATGGNTEDRARLAAAVAAVKFASPRGAFAFDPETHNVVQEVYLRQVRETGPALHDVVFGSLGVYKDPG